MCISTHKYNKTVNSRTDKSSDRIAVHFKLIYRRKTTDDSFPIT